MAPATSTHAPRATRIHHPLVPRLLTVRRVTDLSPTLRRVARGACVDVAGAMVSSLVDDTVGLRARPRVRAGKDYLTRCAAAAPTASRSPVQAQHVGDPPGLVATGRAAVRARLRASAVHAALPQCE